MENLRYRIDAKLVSNKKRLFKMDIQTKIFDNDLITIHKNIITLILNKPAYIGMCILELSYDYIKNKYGNRSRLLLTDTGNVWN